MKATLKFLMAITLFLATGCGKQDRIEMAESNAKECNVIYTSLGWSPRGTKGDLLYQEMIHEESRDYLEVAFDYDRGRGLSIKECGERWRTGWSDSKEEPSLYATGDFIDYAFWKRKFALVVARCGLSYQFGNYIYLDGVSGLIYNVAYVFSIPRKLLTYWQCADGVFGYLNGVFTVLWGGVCAIVGCILAPVINTVCHPFETLANLTVGVAYMDHWFTCFIRTNLIASLWDLIWGAIVYPLVKAVLFFT